MPGPDAPHGALGRGTARLLPGLRGGRGSPYGPAEIGGAGDTPGPRSVLPHPALSGPGCPSFTGKLVMKRVKRTRYTFQDFIFCKEISLHPDRRAAFP